MADIISRLKLESGEFDSKIKRAGQELIAYSEHCRKTGLEMGYANRDAKDFAKSLGNMQTTSSTARGKISELSDAFVNLRVMYKNMTDEEKNNQFGKNLAASLDQLKTRIQDAKKDLADVTAELNGAGKASGGGLFGGGKLDGMLQVFGGNLMTKGLSFATEAVSRLGSEMVDMVQQGIELARQGEGIRNAFERLGRGDILDGLRKATHGTVTDLELMKAAVKFNDFKLPLEELGTMLAFAQQKAKDTGQSVDYMVDSIVTGLGRKSLMILDNLGLSATEVKERMAETGDMTKAVGEIIREQMAKAGDYVETAADRAAQANVSLQNKMEELGRKFAPVEEASNQLWTSMKIGILDVVGGPLARLLNGLTDAGRLRNMLNEMNGQSGSGSTQVDRQLNILKAAKTAGSNYYTKTSYSNTVDEYKRQITKADELLKRFRHDHSSVNTVLQDATKQFGRKFSSIGELETFQNAARVMLKEYDAGAKQIMSPVKPVIDTSGAEQSIDSLKGKLAELHAQRKKAIAAGDTDLSKNLAKQIAQTKADIKGLGGTTTTRTATTPKTEEQQNAASIAELVKQYQDLATAAKTADDAQKAGLTERMTKIQGEITKLQDRNAELKKFADEARHVQYPVGSLPQLNEQLKTLQTEQAKALDAKQWKDYQRQIEQTQYKIDALKGKWKDGLQATFKLNIEQQGNTDINTAKPEDIAVTFKADDADVLAKVRDIDGIAIDPKTLTVTVQTQEAIAALQRVDGLTLQPKTAEVTFKADDSDVLAKVRDIDGVTIDQKTMTVTANTADAYNQVQQLLKSVDGKTVTFTVQPKMEMGTSIQNDAGMSAYIASIKQQLETADYGTSLYNGLSAQLADMTTLQNLVGESLKAGLGTAMFDVADETGADFWTRAMEGGVDNIDWQAIVDKINEARKAAGLDAISLDFASGSVSTKEKSEKDGLQVSKNILNAISQLTSGLQSIGIEIPSEIQSVISVMQGVMQVIEAVNTIIGVTHTSALTANTIAMGALTSALWANTTASFIPFANGGIVPKFADGGLIGRAAGGMLIPGNSFSGDNLRMPVVGGGMIGVNSGEVILNQAQAGVIANALEGGGMQALQLSATISGENIRLALNNNSRRTGRGEYVTTRFK